VRVLALTRNASLLVALGSMMRDWEVVNVRDVASASEVEPGSAVALIDFGGTEEGFVAATELYEKGIMIPCVILGDEPTDGANVRVLVRPFSLEDLASAVQEASTKPAVAPVRAPARVDEYPATDADEHQGPTAMPTEPPPEPEPARVKPSRSRPLSVVPPSAEPEPAREDEDDTRVAVQPEIEPMVPEPMPEDTAAQPVVERPKPALPPRPAPRQPQTIAASTAQAAIEEQEIGAPGPGRWRLRRKPARAQEAADASEPPLMRQLKKAATDAAALEALVDELPFLADLDSMADGLVAEVETQFSAPVVSVFVRREDGYHAIAQRGLSRVETGMVVADTQPLFSDVLQTGEGVLIQPVDLAQGLVAGIGGARTEALMAVPAVVHGNCVAIVIAGRSRFDETDLDRLADLATEAAPGLAVALALARLRERI
jgi:GAF domain